MTSQPEQLLEDNLVAQLEQLGYRRAHIRNEEELLDNLRVQLEVHNKVTLSDHDFKQILNSISKGNVFERAKILRDRVQYVNDKGEHKTIELINQLHWCQNQFQVAQQISNEGTYKNRYDVTLLINGLPLVQIELKRRGLELKEAFNQINRYERHSFGSGLGLFQFVQLFVISNGVDTKYYANSPIKARSFKQTFFWTDVQNNLITQLDRFADVFLEPCHLSKMITKYIVLNESQRILMVLRPYQYYATEAIVERVKTTNKFGFIWHTTGSGKTLTSFKTAQLLTNLKEVYKVVFVVDRKDLDYQTTKEFKSFSKDSIDGTNNTNALVRQLADDTKLIVTTIQKLNTAIVKKRYQSKMTVLQDKKIVFIFDECHRSQFGKTHEEIKTFFKNAQLFGFTGTPIFPENAGTNEFGKRTTEMLFGDCLHKYVITNAIKDGNVLKFSVEYISTFKKKEQILDINVEDIDEQEVMEAPKRLENIVDYIIQNHSRKTHNRKFTAIFCVQSVDILMRYMSVFNAKRVNGEHDLRIATIFSYDANPEDKEARGFLEDDDFLDQDEYSQLIAAEPKSVYGFKHPREQLENYIETYNQEFKTNFTTKDSHSFYLYYNDIAKRVKHQQIDVLVVVNMFLTGFDSKTLNTLYVDKNLQYHGLIQAFSRTNRILDDVKSQGNIVCFRNLKAATDDAIGLFSRLENKSEIIMEPYEDYVRQFNAAFIELLKIAPTVGSVDQLSSEVEELEFIKAFRELMRLRNKLSTFTEFDFEHLSMAEQSFEDYKSKYLDLYDRTKNYNEKEKVSILDDIDFELELIHKDEINVAYILNLLAKLKEAAPDDYAKQTKHIIDLVAGEVHLRSKRELIEKFIAEQLPVIEDSDDIAEAFERFWNDERRLAMIRLSVEEKMDPELLQQIIGDYLFTRKKPLRDDIIASLQEKPGLKERAATAERITQRIFDFVEMYE